MNSADAHQVSIAARIAQLLETLAGQLPATAMKVFGDEQADLDARGLPEGVAMPGATVPNAHLFDVDGKPTTLADAIAGRATVIVLYRGAWCPYCNLTLRAYQEELVPQLQLRHVDLLAVSPQKPDASLTMQQTDALTFRVLSDPGNQIAAALGVLTAPTHEAQLAAHQAIGLNLVDTNADGTDGLPMPTVMILDETRAIRWIDVHPNYTTRTEVSDILGGLDTVLG